MKKKNRNAPNSRMVILGVGALVVLSIASLGYLWQQTEIHALGSEMKQLELQLEELHRTNERLSRRYAEMTTPGALDRRVREMRLGISAPQVNQMIRMVEPTNEAKEWAAGEPQYRNY